MKKAPTKILCALFFCFAIICTTHGQTPQGFNYQAIARDGVSGNPLANTLLQVEITIQSDSLGGTIFWQELFPSVTTNNFGLFTLILGKGTRQAASTVATFNDVNWVVLPKFIKTRIYNGSWKEMGSSRLWSVPYALVSQSVTGLKSLSVRGNTSVMDSALFEVKNNLGKTVFAVYNEGVRISVADGVAKGATKGGFAIGGFDGAKTPGQEYLRVTPDSTRVYVKDMAKGATKGGFAIGGFDGVKGATGNFLNLTKENYFIGHESGSKINGGLYNSSVGYQTGKNLSTGSNNTMLGHLAGISATSGNNNILIGDMAGYSLTNGNHNTLIGSSAGYSHTDQEYNVMIGTAAGYHINAGGWSGSFNAFIGINAGYAIEYSRDNTFLGTNAGYWVENGSGNTFVGIDAGRGGGDRTWAHGTNYAFYNTFFGTDAGYNIVNGTSNTAIGYGAGESISSGSGNIFLGYMAGASETGSNKLYISNSYNNPPLIYGDFSTGRIGLGTITPGYKLEVVGDINVSSGNFKINGANISAASLGAEPTLTKGNLSATGPILLNATQQLIGGAAVISIADATTSAKGAVQLSNLYNGVSQALAVTEKALSDGLATKESSLLKGNLTATGPILLNATQQLIGGAAVISIADATTSAKGAVQLSNSYNGSSQTLATTEKALTDGLATKATGQGTSMGKIFVSGTGNINIVTIAGGLFALNWDVSGNWIEIVNTSPSIQCNYWYQKQDGPTTSGNSSMANASSAKKIISSINIANAGYEINFGQADGTAGWCTVWLQYYNGALVGHYIKY